MLGMSCATQSCIVMSVGIGHLSLKLNSVKNVPASLLIYSVYEYYINHVMLIVESVSQVSNLISTPSSAVSTNA